MANPTAQVPTESIRFDEDKVYWPADPTKTSDTTYAGEMMGMRFDTGYAEHFDDSFPKLFLGTKEQIVSRFQTDTPATDFKYLIRRPKYFQMPLNTGTTSIPAAIGSPAYATDSGHVQLTTAALNNNNLAGMVVDIGRSGSTGSTGGILSLTGATTVTVCPPNFGALVGLVVQGFLGIDATAAATVGTAAAGLLITGGRGGNTTGTGASTGGAGASITLTGGAGGNAAAGTGNGGAGGNIVLNPGAGGTSSGGSAGAQGTVQIMNGTAPANAATCPQLRFSSTAALGIYVSNAAPTFTAAQGSICLNTAGSSTSTRLFVNTTGSTTWTNFTSAA